MFGKVHIGVCYLRSLLEDELMINFLWAVSWDTPCVNGSQWEFFHLQNKPLNSNPLGNASAAFGSPPALAAAAQSLPDLGIMANSARRLRQ